jgi:hypothetical protein
LSGAGSAEAGDSSLRYELVLGSSSTTFAGASSSVGGQTPGGYERERAPRYRRHHERRRLRAAPASGDELLVHGIGH